MSKGKDLKLSVFYDENKFAGHINLIKFLLMPFVFIALFGSPFSGKAGSYISVLSNFAALAFFVLCGFLTLPQDIGVRKKKIARGLKRSFNFFVILFVSYLVISVGYLAVSGNIEALYSTEFLRLRTLFDFLVLNVWPLPVGNAIWFIHSLTYAYAFFFIVEKLKLSKIYTPLTFVLIAFMILSGELAKVVGFPYFRYNYIPGGAITKALPYMLVGMMLRKHVDKLSALPQIVYAAGFVVGVLCAIGEIRLLSSLGILVYMGNTVGYGIMAVSVCCFAIVEPNVGAGFFVNHGRRYARRMYALAQPFMLLVSVTVGAIDTYILSGVTKLGSLISFTLCLGASYLIGRLKFGRAVKRGKIKR